ncbi:unnamed protein product, partial [Leptidea sinapis]
MRKKETTAQSPGRSLIATRTNQTLQRKSHGSKSHLPRSYSSPAEKETQDGINKHVMRSYSSPESKSRRNSESYQMKSQNSCRSEDSDLESFENFDESFLDLDADIDESFRQYDVDPDVEEPKKVVTTLLPGSGLQKVRMKPISSNNDSWHFDKQNKKDTQKQNTGIARFNFRPLLVKVPTQTLQTDMPQTADIEDLETSPPLEIEVAEIEEQLNEVEKHIGRGAATISEESDDDTVSF